MVDSTDQGCAFVKVYVDSAGYKIHQTYTDADGYYFFGLDTGNYRVSVDSLDSSFSLSCNGTARFPVTISVSNQVNDHVDFALMCPPGYDLGVVSVNNSQGFLHRQSPSQLQVKVADLTAALKMSCFSGIQGIVHLVLKGPVHFSDYDDSGILKNDTLSFPVSDFSANSDGVEWMVELSSDPEADEGEEVCLEVYIDPSQGDSHVENNSYRYCCVFKDTVLENAKAVSPVSVVDSSDEWLTYTLYFQNNTGGPVENLQIVDELGYKVDTTSFMLTAFSHRPYVRILRRKINFYFPQIQLPDFSADSELSKGYVQFRIKRLPWLYNGEKITNTAAVFFDHQSMISTNTTVNVIGLWAGLESFVPDNESDLFLFPNPVASGETINIWSDQFIDKRIDFEIIDMQGRVFGRLSTLLNDHQSSFRLPQLSSGWYLINVLVDNQVMRSKLAVK